MTASAAVEIDEETPLLPEEQQKQTQTPIPWGQVSVLLVLQLVEPFVYTVIFPFAPEFVRKSGITHGDEARVGYYVGLLEAIFFATQALTVYYWSRVSDIIGRRPVILAGLSGLVISMYSFGLSTTYWGAVFSRALNGALNGNIGVLKSMLADITDSTNVAQVWGWLPISWATGGTIGPIVGGSLSRPADRFPDIFGQSEFHKKYPYFLACAVPATFAAVAWAITVVYLKEPDDGFRDTHIPFYSPAERSDRRTAQQLVDDDRDNDDSSNDAPTRVATPTPDDEKPYPLQALFIRPVLIASGNYAALCFVDIAYRAIQPLFFSTPVELGGLGLEPPTIGVILSVYGIVNGIFQFFFFARVVQRWGAKNVFTFGMAVSVPLFVFYPAMNVIARSRGVGYAVWIVVGLQTLCSLGISLCYGCVFMYIAASAPNKASVGATNGLAQLMGSVVRTFGPALASSLFSLSIEHHYLGGHLVYVLLLAMSLVAVAGALALPRKMSYDRGGK
ncbi:MFS general substrate transporter [Auriscalpium vulgare]|uniref:MFS general substrate transporter n=1 Tax=Auriscalpium vulgare TaxID=40419 RepID=A0ACB8SA92_9AGAM|nr:MFS general substrate transporter [Auriscalpium vulgare]